MADTKISDLTDGAPAVSTDIIPVARSGANRRVTVGDVVSAANVLAAAQAMTTAQKIDLAAALGTSYILQNASAIYELTGGSTGTKTTLLEVSIPDGALDDADASIFGLCRFWYTRNTNTKTFGVDIGTSAATATEIYTRSRNSSSHGADDCTFTVRKHSDGSDRLMITVGDVTGAVYYGGSYNTTEPRKAVAVSPTATGLKLYFWGNLVTANTDFVRLYECMVKLDRSA